jgi:hypothetical protein
MSVYVERQTRIYQDDCCYIVRPNADVPERLIDIVYQESGKELNYICVTDDAVPALIEALQEALAMIEKNKN